MVDALRRAHRALRADGVVVDVHPTASNAAIEIGDTIVGRVDAADAPGRHAAAGAALDTAVGERLFAVERAVTFDFLTYADSIEELRDHIADTWRHAQVA